MRGPGDGERGRVDVLAREHVMCERVQARTCADANVCGNVTSFANRTATMGNGNNEQQRNERGNEQRTAS